MKTEYHVMSDLGFYRTNVHKLLDFFEQHKLTGETEVFYVPEHNPNVLPGGGQLVNQ